MTLKDNTTASQCANIWQHLLSGKSITRLDSLSLFGCVNLPGRIYDLKRRYDMPDIPAISTGKVCVTNRYGKTVRVAKYTLNPDFAKKIFSTSNN